ncbi:MAG: hypothetical protein ACTSWY_02750 [Promethearchaeota archaeon]
MGRLPIIMGYISFFPIIGAFFLIFRLWICENKLKDILGSRRSYLSRFINYYYFIAMVLNFESDIFNLILVNSLPLLIIGFFINDIPAYYKFGKQYKDLEFSKKCWVLAEGLTLHPPMIITGIIFYVIGLKTVFSSLNLISIISVLILGIFPLILFDKRWSNGRAIAKWMLIGGIGTLIGVVLYISPTNVLGGVFLPIIGSLFFIFRLWTCEVKSAEFLDYRKHFLSRFGNYYFCIALILNFEIEAQIFNLIILGSLPLLIIAFLTFDVPFFIKCNKENNQNQKKIKQKDILWLYIERALLHPPLLIACILMYISDPRIYVPSFDIIVFITASILVFGIFFAFDERAKLKSLKRGVGIWIFIASFASLIGMCIYLLI